MTNRKDGEYDLLTSSLVMTIPRINILTTPASAKGSIAYDINSNVIVYSNGTSWSSVSTSGNDLLGYSFTNPGYPTLPPDGGIPIFDATTETWTVSPITGDIGMTPTGDSIIFAIDGNPVGPFSFLTAGDVMSWDGSSWVNGSVSGSPTGPAGGSLAGTYPNPTLTTTGVVAGAYTTTNLTVDAQGRVTTISNGATSFPPSGAAGGDLTGTYPNPTLTTTGVVAGAYTTANLTVDAQGRVTTISNGATSFPPTGPAGGDLTGTYPNPTLTTTTVTPGSYGSATQVSTFTVDTKGRLTTAGNTTISGVAPGGAAGGVLAGTYPNPDFAQMTLTAAKTQIGFATAAVDTSVALGPTAVAQDIESVVLGSDANADGERCTVTGYFSLSENGSVQTSVYGARCYTDSSAVTLLGYNTSANGSTNATCVGRSALASGAPNAVSVGTGASTSASSAVAIGQNAVGGASGSIALGSGINANQVDGFFVRHRNGVASGAGGSHVGVYDATTNELGGLAHSAGFDYVLTGNPFGDLAWAAPPGAVGSASGDLSGNYPNPTVAKLQTQPVSNSVPANGANLVWDGSQWLPVATNIFYGTNTATNRGTTCCTLGEDARTDSATDAVAVGKLAIARATNSVALGRAATTSTTGTSSVSIGSGSSSTGSNSVSVGVNSGSIGASAVAIAISSSAAGAQGVAIGSGASAGGTNGVALGRDSVSSTTNCISAGYLAAASAASAIAVGAYTVASAAGSIALGDGITANQVGGFFVKHRNDVTPAAGKVAIYDATTNELTGLPYAGGSNYVLTSNAAGAVAWAAGGTTGTAGGDLTGTYPNPTLAATGATAGAYEYMTATVDAGGRITSASKRQITVDVTLAEWITLATLNKVIVPAPGVGFYNIVLQASISRIHGGAALVLGSDIYLTYGMTTAGAIAYYFTASNFTGATSHVVRVNGQGAALSRPHYDLDNAAINIRVTGGNWSGGTGSTFKVTVVYSVQPI